jgi:hypothetical protein
MLSIALLSAYGPAVLSFALTLVTWSIEAASILSLAGIVGTAFNEGATKVFLSSIRKKDGGATTLGTRGSDAEEHS